MCKCLMSVRGSTPPRHATSHDCRVMWQVFFSSVYNRFFSVHYFVSIHYFYVYFFFYVFITYNHIFYKHLRRRARFGQSRGRGQDLSECDNFIAVEMRFASELRRRSCGGVTHYCSYSNQSGDQQIEN